MTAPREPEFKPDTELFDYKKLNDCLCECAGLPARYATLENARPEIQSRLLAPVAPGLDREKLIEAMLDPELKIPSEYFNAKYGAERYWVDQIKSGRFDAPAASRGADKLANAKKDLKAVLDDMQGTTDAECLNKSGYWFTDLSKLLASLEAGAPEGEK
jgi:hypothetical protein